MLVPGDVSVLVKSNEPGGVTLSRLLLRRSLIMRDSVTPKCLWSVFKGFCSDHPPHFCLQSQRKTLTNFPKGEMRYSSSIVLTGGQGWWVGTGHLSLGGYGHACQLHSGPRPHRWGQVPLVGTCWGQVPVGPPCLPGRASEHERLGQVPCPCPGCALPARGHPRGSRLHPRPGASPGLPPASAEQMLLGGLPGAWQPSHLGVSVLARLCSKIN